MAYGQAKTANCLMALYLAEKLGDRGLQAYSLHPGAILSTSLGNHLDGDFSSLRKFKKTLSAIQPIWIDRSAIMS
jgi:NAD(P)-dependent dehydrogenase (short-subunit alcohol dehydrogenase family)